jgi:hypothetical protein
LNTGQLEKDHFMITLRKHSPWLLIAVMLWTVGVHGQTVTKVGTTAAKFLSIPVGGRALAMGGAYVAVANDASAMYWNPAGIARATQSEAIFAHASWVADIDFNYAGIVVPAGNFGIVGVNFTSMSMAEMERTTEASPEGTQQFFSAGSFAIGGSYANQLTDWFSIGGNVKYVSEHIWNSSATGFAVDIGTMFTTPFPGLKFGAAISNFGSKMHMTGDDLIIQTGVTSNAGGNSTLNGNLATDAFDLPLNLAVGFAYQPLVDEDKEVTIAADFTHPNDNAESMRLGGEVAAFQKIVALRAGYKRMLAGNADSEEDFTVGGGVRYSFTDDLTVRFDYAFEKFGRLENVHKFSVGVLF